MATNFPTSADDATTVGGDSLPAAGTALSDSTAGHPSHSDLHENVGDAVQAVEAKIGTGSSTPAANTVLTGTGSGTSGWATVSTAMIGDDQVTQAKIADDAVGADQLAASAVVTASIVDDQVTQAKIGPGAVGTTELGSDAVNGDKIADDAINSEHIAAGAIDTEHIADSQVTAGKLAEAYYTESESDARFLGISAKAADSDKLDNLNSTQFLRSDTADTFGANLTVSGVLDANDVVKITDGSEASPALTFDADEDTGIYRDTADKMVLVAGGNGSAVVESTAFSLDLGVGFFAWPGTGTGNDAEWVATGFGNFYLVRNSSLRSEKENIQDPGDELTADMIDQVEPKLWNRIHSPGIPEIGPIAEDMEAISPHLGAHGYNEDGTTFLTGINKTTYLSLLVLAVKDLRTQVADLTARIDALEG